MPVCGYARGYIERGLAPDSLFSKATATNVYLTDDTAGASSSSSGVPHTPSGGVDTSGDLRFVRMRDIQHLASFFIGPPEDLLKVLPAAKYSSKVSGMQNSAVYLPKTGLHCTSKGGDVPVLR